MQLQGKTALVTGAGRQIGQAIALALAEAGANIVAHYHRSEAGAAETVAKARLRGVRAAAVGADLADPDQVRDLIRWSAQALGVPDLLVNNAAIFEPGTLLGTSEEAWDRHFALNLRAPFVLTQVFASFLEDREGKIVNVADWRAAYPGRAYAAYTVAKAGLLTLTEIAARELAPRVQVNALALGPVTGPELERLVERIPAGRIASLPEVTDAVLFLVRNDYVTGETLFLDGGAHLVHG